MKINLTYTVDNNLIPDFYTEVLECYGLSAKNIKNSSFFIIQNLFSSYSFSKELNLYVLKNNLHSNQSDIINFINQSIVKINSKLKVKFDNLSQEEKIDKYGNEKKLDLFNLYSEFIDKKTYYQILDKSLLENTIKAKELNSEYKDYSIVHSHLAQSVLQKVCDEYQNYFKALKFYKSEKNSFTGKPQEPSYKAKNSAISFDISIQRFANGKILQILKKHKVYKDYAKTELISQDLIKEFNSFNLLEVIEKDIKNKNLTGNIVGIRVIPGKFKRKPKVEYILSFEKELKGFYPDLINKSKVEKNKDFFKLKDKEKLALIKDYFNQPNKELPYFMALDLGVINFAAVAIYNQNRDLNYIVSGQSLKKKIINIDSKIDQTKVELCRSDIKSIISKKDKSEQLTREELRLLKEFYMNLSVNSSLVKYQLRKSDITNDFLHKLSKCLVCDAKEKEIKVIIVGKNKGWKDGINNGSSNNRNMYNFPHARFIEILKYKAMLNDILVIETEESYTSKTSFIDNEELKVYTETTQGTKNQLSGKRINQIFITKDKIKLHADINGSFNIVRKVLKSFHYDKKKITLSYSLVELNLSGKKKVRAFNKSRKTSVDFWQSPALL